jgi:alpha-tubulin suppressor-like RCC1 family protein
MQRKLQTIKRSFGYTAYTWGNSETNGWSSSAQIAAIDSLRGQVAKIELGPRHSAIITTSGDLYTWGDSDYGKLGLASTKEKKVKTPTLVSFFAKNNIKIESVALGRHHTLALDTQGRVFSFGKGSFTNSGFINLFFSKYVALGHPKAEHVYIPKIIEKFRGEPIDQISTGKHFGMALSKKGDLYAWGRGEYGVLGFGNKEVSEPLLNEIIRNQCIETNSSIIKIDSVSDFSSVLFSDGSVRSFGNNDQGTMGLGSNLGFDFCESINFPSQMELTGDQKKVVDIDLAECCTAILTNEKKVYMCGLKLFFQPELFDIDYESHKVKTFGACDRGIAVVTEENKIFSRGNFWIKGESDEDVDTGIHELSTEKYFHNKEIVKVGGKYTGRFALVKED